MNIKLLLILIFTIVFGAFQASAAPADRQIKVKVGDQKKVSKTKLTVRFVSVAEDSRCPAGTQCIWAGNARVEIKVRKSKGAWKTLELNTGLEPQTVTFEGYEIKLADLTPVPQANVPINKNSYTATFTVRKM